MRVALFGGTFDPPHRGHLAIARAAADAFRLDQVLFAPVALQPLKAGRATTNFADRLAMTRLACAADPRFSPSTLDAPRENARPNYTVETLAALRAALPDATLFNLVGADSFLSLPQWRDPHLLLQMVEWIVVSRPGFSLETPEALAPLHLTAAERSRVHFLHTVHDDVSSTDLRRRLSAAEPCSDLLPPAVADYIREHHLYTTP